MLLFVNSFLLDLEAKSLFPEFSTRVSQHCQWWLLECVQKCIINLVLHRFDFHSWSSISCGLIQWYHPLTGSPQLLREPEFVEQLPANQTRHGWLTGREESARSVWEHGERQGGGRPEEGRGGETAEGGTRGSGEGGGETAGGGNMG